MSAELIANALTAALSASAAAASSDVAKEAVSDAYDTLKTLLGKRFGEGHEVPQSVDKLDAKPDSPARTQLLAQELSATTAGQNPEILSASQSLLDLERGRGIYESGGSVILKILGTPLHGSHGMFSPRWSPEGQAIVAFSNPSLKLNTFDIAKQRWSVLLRNKGELSFPVWS